MPPRRHYLVQSSRAGRWDFIMTGDNDSGGRIPKIKLLYCITQHIQQDIYGSPSARLGPRPLQLHGNILIISRLTVRFASGRMSVFIDVLIRQNPNNPDVSAGSRWI